MALKKTLYDGEIELRKTFSPYKYYLNGEEVPSTTTITGILTPTNALMGWYSNLVEDCIRDTMEPGREYSEVEIGRFAEYVKKSRWRSSGEAQDLGSLVHKKIEEHTENKIKYGRSKVIDRGEPEPDVPHITMPVDDRAYEAVKEFLLWERDHDVNWLAAEKLLATREHGVAGTTDALAEIDGKLTIVDYKTSKSGEPYLSYRVQISAYRKFLLEEYPHMEIPQAGIFKCPKDGGEFGAYLYDDLDELEIYWQTFLACKKIYDVRQEYD